MYFLTKRQRAVGAYVQLSRNHFKVEIVCLPCHAVQCLHVDGRMCIYYLYICMCECMCVYIVALSELQVAVLLILHLRFC